MTNKEMQIELKENDVMDNPFDVMLHHAMEMTRDLLFACHRLRDPEVPEAVCTNTERLESYMDKIKEEFSKLLDMSEETVAMCRETSYYYQPDAFEDLNKSLLEFDGNIETVWSRCVPNRNDRFEQIRLGKESDQYIRLVELRKIIDESEELSSVDSSYLHNLCDVISRPRECIAYHWNTKEDLERKQEIIKKYRLTRHDIQYMLAYKFKK